MRSEGAQDIPEEALQELTTYDTPILAAGVVSGRVFKDQDADGALEGLMSASRALRYHWHLDHAVAQARQPHNQDSSGCYSFSELEPEPTVFTARPNACRQSLTADSNEFL